jgi:hypothetical protein
MVCPFVVIPTRASPPNPCVPNGDREDSLGLSNAMPQAVT